MKELDLPQVKEMLQYTARELIAAKDYLTQVDAKIGDGDHGIGMENGFTSLLETIEGKEYDTINCLYQDAGMAMLTSMGGASGVIFSSLLLGAVKGMGDFSYIDGRKMEELLSGGLAAIQKRGGAMPGDKTMVDALAPAVEAIRETGKEESDLTVLMEKAAEAAKDGMEKTKQYVAKYGRAKSLMERAVGYQDAGATSTWLILDAMCRFLKEKDDMRKNRQKDAPETIVVGCDNAAIELKETVIEFLESRKIQVEDMGCGYGENITYPRIAERVCKRIIESGCRKRGILLCGTGIGMAIAANKFKGIRAAVCHDSFSAERAVLSNDCNVLCMGERVIGTELAKKNLKEWLDLKFIPGPSSAKISDISSIERMNMK